jgi:hypothetical protein
MMTTVCGVPEPGWFAAIARASFDLELPKPPISLPSTTPVL